MEDEPRGLDHVIKLQERSLSEDERSSLRSIFHEKAGLRDQDLPVIDILLETTKPVDTTTLINSLVPQAFTREEARRSLYGIRSAVNSAFKGTGIAMTNTLIDPARMAKGSKWWIENVERLLPEPEEKVVVSEEPRIDIEHWLNDVPAYITVSSADDRFIKQAILTLRNCIQRGLTINPISAFRKLFATNRQNTPIYEPIKENSIIEPESTISRVQTIPPVISTNQAIEVEQVKLTVIQPMLEEEDKEQELERFSIKEIAALSLLVGSLNGTSIGIDEDTPFEFRVEKEVVDICNRLVWSLPFEYGNTIKLYAQDYLNLRRGALEKIKEILMLDEAEILEVARKQDNEYVENLLVGLAIGGVSQRQKNVWFFDQILQRPQEIAWNDETSYITQLWRETNLVADPGNSMVDVIENTLQTDEYLEIIPVDNSRTSIELANGHEVRVGTLERRDVEVREKVRAYIKQVKDMLRMPSLVNSGQLSQYFKPAIRASEIDELSEAGYIIPFMYRNNIPYYDIDDVLVLLYMRNKSEKIDVKGLQRELRKIVTEELERKDHF